MELIIQEIAEVIRVEFAEEIQRLLTEVRDISEFIMATQTMIKSNIMCKIPLVMAVTL